MAFIRRRIALRDTDAGRQLNVWLERGDLPLIADVTVMVGVNIGPPRGDTIGGGPSPEIDWGGVESVELIIVVWGTGVTVSPLSHRVTLPRVGKSNDALFDVTPRRGWTGELVIDVMRPGDFALLEEYRVSLELREAEVAQTA